MTPGTKATDSAKAYLIAGDDDFRKQRELEDLLGKLVEPDFADFDLERLEGDTATADRIMAGLAIPPFSSPRRVVLVKFANKMRDEEQDKLATVLERAPDSGCLILVTPAPEKSDGKPRKGSEVKGELSKAVRKLGRVIRVAEKRGREGGADARQFAQSLFVQAGKKIEPAALSEFVQRVGLDYSILDSEARKLIDYSGDSDTISKQDVIEVSSETPEEKIWKLVDAIGAKTPDQAMRFLDELFDTGDRPDAQAPKTLSSIARQFRLIWQAKVLVSAGVEAFKKDSVPEDVRALLPSSPDIFDLVSRQNWQQDRLKSQAARFTRDQLARCFEAIADADAMLKGIEGDVEDPRMIMELLVLRLAG
jgi:DNA polymerase-3 subunit delta